MNADLILLGLTTADDEISSIFYGRRSETSPDVVDYLDCHFVTSENSAETGDEKVLANVFASCAASNGRATIVVKSEKELMEKCIEYIRFTGCRGLFCGRISIFEEACRRNNLKLDVDFTRELDKNVIEMFGEIPCKDTPWPNDLKL